MKVISILLLYFTTLISLHAQDIVAPDFTIIDIEGDSFHLYSELELGKPVVIAFIASWSEISYDLHKSKILEDLNLKYGILGSDQIRILLYEGDMNTSLQDLLGISGNTQGNWLDSISNPFINELELSLPLEIYAPNGFPTIRIIDPMDYKMIEILGCLDIMNEIKSSLNDMISLLEYSGFEFNLQSSNYDVSCFGEGDGEIYLAVTGGYPPYEIEWFDGSSDTQRKNLDVGEYMVTVRDAIGSSLSQSILIAEPSEIMITEIDIYHETSELDNGSISFGIQGGAAPYEFSWNTGSSEMNIMNLSAGEYSVTINDSKDCALTQTFVVEMETNINESLISNLRIYPNPVNDYLYLLTRPNGDLYFNITNNLAQVIKRGQVMDNLIDLENIPAGLYYLELIHEKLKFRQVFIKM